MNLFTRKTPDPRLDAYRQGTRRKWDKTAPVDATSFVVLDLETTGFSIHEDRILSIAALPLSGKRCRIEDLKSWIIYHSDAAVTPATEVHTILPSESSRGISEDAALLELLPLLEGAIIVGHHIQFDAAMLNKALGHHFQGELRNPLLDTAMLAMECIDSFHQTGYSKQQPPGLDEVCAYLGLPLWERHTADGDTFGTAQLFLMLQARMQRKMKRRMVLRDLPLAHPRIL